MTKKRGFFIIVCVALAFLASAVFGSFAQPAFVLGKDNVTVFYAQTLSGGGSGIDYYGRSALSGTWIISLSPVSRRRLRRRQK